MYMYMYVTPWAIAIYVCNIYVYISLIHVCIYYICEQPCRLTVHLTASRFFSYDKAD